MIEAIAEGPRAPGSEEEHRQSGVKCITLYQPYASLVAMGAKHLETRSWRTWYRGPLLIHAAKAFPRRARDLCNREPFAAALYEAGYADRTGEVVDPARLPLGQIVAICTLKHCVRIGTPGIDLPPPEPERSFGDYTSGRYAWVLDDVQPLLKPISASGSMGLWVPDETVLEELSATVAPIAGASILSRVPPRGD